jgi:tetratricopeptide (TPR) repeat protein
MAEPEHSSENPETPLRPTEKGENTAPMEALMGAVAAFQKAMSANNAEQAEAAALSALAAAAEEAQVNPTPELTLKGEAGESEARGDWAGAETCYRKVLALEEAAGKAGLISKAHYDLSQLFQLIGDLEKADACARSATAAARQTDIFPVLVMALENQAMCALRRSDSAGALEAAGEAVALVESGRMYDGMRAGALVIRARCRLASGDLAGSESDLATCKPILLDREVSPLFAGLNSRVASWWEVTAGGRAHREDFPGACEAWTEAVKIRRHVASLARSLKRFGDALAAAGQPQESRSALAEARRLWCELGLPDQALR